MSENIAIPDKVVEDVGRAQYLSITRNAGLPDEIAHETYEENKGKTDKLTEFVLKKDIENGNKTKALIESHNKATNFGGIAGDQLRSFIERIERLETEKQDIAEATRDVYGEAKANGFDTKVMRKLIKIRKQDTADRNEEAEILNIYANALGMQLNLFN